MRARQFTINSNSWLICFHCCGRAYCCCCCATMILHMKENEEKIFKIFTQTNTQHTHSTHTLCAVPRISLDAQYITSRINLMMCVCRLVFFRKKLIIFSFLSFALLLAHCRNSSFGYGLCWRCIYFSWGNLYRDSISIDLLRMRTISLGPQR